MNRFHITLGLILAYIILSDSTSAVLEWLNMVAWTSARPIGSRMISVKNWVVLAVVVVFITLITIDKRNIK